jgi:hypothetical protein
VICSRRFNHALLIADRERRPFRRPIAAAEDGQRSIAIEIVRRKPDHFGFAVQPPRWVRRTLLRLDHSQPTPLAQR